MAATWLKVFLAPVRFFLDGVEQSRDDRVDFRRGFVSSQVPDADGVNVLTYDTEVGAATVTPSNDKVLKRNGSGAAYATTFIGTAFSYATPVEITRDEPIIADITNIDAANGWSFNGSVEPESNAVNTTQADEWRTQINPPVGSMLQSIAARYTPATTHSALPDQPGIQLAIVDEDGGISMYETPAQDNAADLTAYEADTRTVTKTFSTPLEIEEDKRYIVVFYNESGADAEPGLKLHRPARWTTEVYSV